MYIIYLRAKWIISCFRPEPVFHEAICSTNFPHHIKDQPHCKISDISGQHSGNISNGNLATTALNEINVVEAGAGGDDEAEDSSGQ